MLIYDCEIVKAIPSGVRQEGIDYCSGWGDFANMGISCIAVYDFISGEFRVFCKDNLAGFQKLVDRHDVIIGFNSLSFDNRLCEANGITIARERSYDLLVELWRAVGLSETYEYPGHSGFTLEATAIANGCGKKTGNGALAPVMWQQGQVGAVIDYCLHDVMLTKKLINRVLVGGQLNDPRDSDRKLTIRRP